MSRSRAVPAVDQVFAIARAEQAAGNGDFVRRSLLRERWLWPLSVGWLVCALGHSSVGFGRRSGREQSGRPASS